MCGMGGEGEGSQGGGKGGANEHVTNHLLSH